MSNIKEDKSIDRENELYNEFLNLAINRFSWEGLPNGLTSEQLEIMLIKNGTLACFSDDKQGVYILPCHGVSNFNVYGLPVKYNITSLNGQYNKNNVDIDKIVLLKNNPLGVSDDITLSIYAKRINDIEKTQQVNLFQQNIPKIVLGDENSRLTMKNVIEQIKNYRFVIFGKKSLVDSIKTTDVLDTSSPYILDKLQEYKQDLKNELLTFLGINNNTSNDKKERLLVDEVNANNDYVNINLDLMYDLRLKACKEINEKFNLNLSVKKREVE